MRLLRVLAPFVWVALCFGQSEPQEPTGRPPAEEPAPVTSPAAEPPASAVEENISGHITDSEIGEALRLKPPVQLQPAPGRKDFNLRENSKKLWEDVAQGFGLSVVFDPALPDKGQIRFHVADVDFRDAIRALQAATATFAVPANKHLLLVAEDILQKRAELDRTEVVVIPIPEPVSVQEVQEIAAGVRGSLDIRRLMVDSQRRLILLRDRVTVVQLAEKIIEDLMKPKAQVGIEVDFLATDENSSLHYGLSLPASFNLVSFGAYAKNLITSIPQGLTNFLTFGQGSSRIGFGVTSASLFALASEGNSRTLLKSEIVASDGQPGLLHVGERYPIITNQYLGDTSGTGQVFTPPPTINYEDLGLMLKITPHVHDREEMTLEVDAEFKLLGSTSLDGIPLIENRKYNSKVRLVNGEWAVLAGLMTESDTRTASGLAGLSIIPLLRDNRHNHDRAQTLIVFKPHVLNTPPSESISRPAWVGTEAHPLSTF